MKVLIAAFLVLTSLSAFGNTINKVTCKGYVSFEQGTMQGNATITLERMDDGTWEVKGINAGENLSKDENVILVDSYGTFFRKRGSFARYDIEKNILEFKYKYDSGWTGGGVQKTRGTFDDCVVE